MRNLIVRMKQLLPSPKNLGKEAVNQFHEARTVLCNKSGLEAFEIAIGVGIAVVLGVIALSNNKDLFSNTIWPKVTSNTSSLFS